MTTTNNTDTNLTIIVINPARTITMGCKRCNVVEHVTVGGTSRTDAICQALDATRYSGCDCKKKVTAVRDLG